MPEIYIDYLGISVLIN